MTLTEPNSAGRSSGGRVPGPRPALFPSDQGGDENAKQPSSTTHAAAVPRQDRGRLFLRLAWLVLAPLVLLLAIAFRTEAQR